MDGSTVLPTLAPKVPYPGVTFLPPSFFRSKTNPTKTEGMQKKKNTTQMEPKLPNQPTEKSVKKNGCSAGIPKNTFVVLHEKKFSDSSPPSPKSTLLKFANPMPWMAPRIGHSFFCMATGAGRILGWRHWPGAKRPRKFKRLRLRCR